MKLSDKKLQELKSGKIQFEDLNDRYFINSKKDLELENILKLLNANICNFKELVDKFKNIKDSVNDPCLYGLLRNKELFKELIENNKLNTEDLRYLLNTLDKIYELRRLCENTSLIKEILNEFVLNKEIVDRLTRRIEEIYWCKDRNIHTLFDYIEDQNKYNEELLKLNELNETVYLLNSFDLSIDQKLELSEVLKDSEIAQNTLIQLIDNHLEDQYDFETLKNILTKEDKKKLKTKFNF